VISNMAHPFNHTAFKLLSEAGIFIRKLKV